MSLLLFGNNAKVVKSASQVIKETIGFEKIDDIWYVTFSTIQDRKGYGRQRVPVSDFNDFVMVLKEAVQNGIHNETEELSCIDVVKKSLVEAEDGSIRFKTEPTKGKKPTLFTSLDDFSSGVEMLASVQDLVLKQSEKLK